MPNAIGIDLGTTNSCVAYMKSDTVVEVVENHYGNKTTPSIVHFGMFKDVGEAAQAHRARDPQNTVFQVKRLMGRAASDRVLASRRYPFKIVPAESGEVCVGVTVRDNEGREESRTYDPELISSMILRFMMILAQTHIGSKVTDAVITVPANFNNAQRQATKTAGLMAGLNVLRIVNEPTAAALAYGFHLNSEKERVVLVYDLGGGTFDVSIVRAHGMIDDVLATAGETYLGGEDFDHRLYEHAFQEFRNQGIDIVQEEEYGLLNSCEKAKIALSVSDRATIELFKNGRRHSFEITRDKFEELCMDLFEKTILCVTDAMLEAKLTKEMIDDVVLVGGSSRIPKVQQMVREFFDDKELQFNIPPDHAVAYGAAILAESLSANPDQDCNSIRGAVKLSDVLPFSLGTQCAYERFSVMLRRNTKYPCSKTQGYHNAEDNLTALTVLILEGESADAKENAVLGQCHIPVPERNVGENKMLVTYSVDADGILSVHLRDEDTTEEASTRVETSRFTEEQRMAVVRNARLEEEDDKIQRARHLARTSFANAMDSVRRSVHATKSTEKKEKLRKLIENEDSWFKTQESPSNEDFIARASSIKGKLAAIMNS